ncbi:polysaccharide deacetylase family protein [archaeon]|nr:polysaccharide deacetylase family protein [archaeon]
MVKKCLVVMYHYVRDMYKTPYPKMKGMLIDKFKDQVKKIMQDYTIISLNDYLDYLSGEGDIPDRSCILSFDDGLKDHYENVFPVLKEYGVSGCFFVTTKPLVDFSVLPVQKIQFLLAKLGVAKLAEDINSLFKTDYPTLLDKFFIDDKKHEGREDWYDDLDTTFTSNLKYSIAGLPFETKNEIVDELFSKHFSIEEEFSKVLYLNWGEIKEMVDSGMVFGTHGHTHPDLSRLNKGEQKEEFKMSKQLMEENLGVEISVCSYPYGVFTDETIDVLKELGYSCALAAPPVREEINDGRINPFKIRRVDTVNVI